MAMRWKVAPNLYFHPRMVLYVLSPAGIQLLPLWMATAAAVPITKKTIQCIKPVSCFPLFLAHAAGRCTHHATSVGRKRKAGRRLAESSCVFYVAFLWILLHSSGESALLCISVLVLTSKSHTRGVCNRLLADPRQWKRPRGVRSDPGKGGAQAPWSQLRP